MITVEQIRAASCPTCEAKAEEPCVVNARHLHGVHAVRRRGYDELCRTCFAQPGEGCVSSERLVRITAGVEVHPARWEVAVAAYAKAVQHPRGTRTRTGPTELDHAIT